MVSVDLGNEKSCGLCIRWLGDTNPPGKKGF